MPAKVKDKDKDEKEIDQIDALLESKDIKGTHYGSVFGDAITKPQIISTGSYFFDQALGGGYRSAGWARFYAEPECGKSSIGLCWGKQWQDYHGDDAVVVAFNAEGRLTPDLIARSGIDTSKERFRLIHTNLSETIWHMIETLITDNPKKKKYFFLVDSTDACVRKCDVKEEKNIGEAEKVGGGATIISAAGKRLSLLFNVKQHFLFMTSQVRDKVNTQGPAGAGKDASGGNAPKFYSSLTGEIKKPWTKTYIYDNPSDTNSEIIGRMVEIKLHKTPNEKSGIVVKYPVKYGLVGGVWRAYEAMMIAETFGFLIGGASGRFEFTDEFIALLGAKGIVIEQKYHGQKRLREMFDETPALVDYIMELVRKTL